MPLKAVIVMVKTLDRQDRKEGREGKGREGEQVFAEKIHERLKLLSGVLLGMAIDNVNAFGKLLDEPRN